MPTIVPTFFTRLTGDAATSAIIGKRVYPEYAREADKTYPLAVFKVENVTNQLASGGLTGLVSADFTVAAIAPAYKAAAQLADVIQSCLDGKQWTDADNGICIQGCFLKDDGRSENVITQQDTEAATLYATELSFLVWFNATS